MEFYLEAHAPALKAIVTVGARPGYDESAVPFSLEHVANIVSASHHEIESAGKRSIPAIISQGTLVGRSTNSDYREGIYSIDFTLSPRVEPMSNDDFWEVVSTYAQIIGRELKQERVYIDYRNKTLILRKK